MFLDPVLVAFGVMAVGAIFQKTIGFDHKNISDLVLYVTGPALIFVALYSHRIYASELYILTLAAIAVMFASGIFAFFAFSAIGYKNSGIILPSMFMNSGYLGYPVALFALGEIGLQKAIIFDTVETILLFTLGIFLVHNKGETVKGRIKAVFSLPLIYVIFLGLLFNFTAVPLPVTLIAALSMVGSATIPLALLALGGRLVTLELAALKVPLLAVFSRIVVGGIAGFVFVKIFALEGVVASVVLLLSVMPPAVNSYVLNEKFSADPHNAASAVLIGTLFSIISIAAVLAAVS